MTEVMWRQMLVNARRCRVLGGKRTQMPVGRRQQRASEQRHGREDGETATAESDSTQPRHYVFEAFNRQNKIFGQ